MLKNWAEILNYNKFSLQTFLSSERQQIQWQGEGLPSDQLSIQNAIVILKVPVFIKNCFILSHKRFREISVH